MTSALRAPTSRPVVALVGFLVVCYGVAALGAVSATSSISTWYATLSKPSFNPPDWIFAPVWTTLYGLMAIAGWLVWRTPRVGPGAAYRRSGLVFFAVQLLLNGVWTPVFFYLHQILPALIIIVGLWVAILVATLRFWRVDRFASALMVPYLLWLFFATVLNFEIYRLN